MWVGGADRGFDLLQAAMAGRFGTGSPQIFEVRMTNAMPAPVCSLPLPTDFDRAIGAALAAGWTHRPAFDAVVYMKINGMADAEIEAAFRDCARRVQ